MLTTALIIFAVGVILLILSVVLIRRSTPYSMVPGLFSMILFCISIGLLILQDILSFM